MNDDTTPGFDYPVLVRAALVGMVRGLLARTAAEGLPGEHHFYLTFGTTEAGVVLPKHLLKQFPEEMTIVLQHQFWNLAVEEGSFSVTVRFGGSPERLTVPWEALHGFADPSVGFGVRLKETGTDADSVKDSGLRAVPVASPPEDAPADGSRDATPKVIDFGAFRRRTEGETEI